MIASIEPLISGFALSDPTDSRHQYITQLKKRFGAFLRKASNELRRQGEENTVDAVQMLVGFSPFFKGYIDVTHLALHRYVPSERTCWITEIIEIACTYKFKGIIAS